MLWQSQLLWLFLRWQFAITRQYYLTRNQMSFHDNSTITLLPLAGFVRFKDDIHTVFIKYAVYRWLYSVQLVLYKCTWGWVLTICSTLQLILQFIWRNGMEKHTNMIVVGNLTVETDSPLDLQPGQWSVCQAVLWSHQI